MASIGFKFQSDAPGGDSFTVIGFNGTEALSRLYRYEISLKAPVSAAVDLDDMLDSTARLVTLMEDGTELPVNGMLAEFEERQTAQGYVHYRTVLVPRLWRLSTYRTNEIYTTEKTVDQIITTVLEAAGFASGYDYDIRGLTGRFLQRDYVCQFRESDIDFLSRLMENEGIYFYFQQKPDTETMIIANGAQYYPLFNPDAVYDAGESHEHRTRSIRSWVCRKQRLPLDVTVRDYNPSQPSLDVAGRYAVDQRGAGTEYLYGDHFADEEEAAYLAEIRAEEFACRKTRFYGEGSMPGFMPGFTFNLASHPNDRYNGNKYLLVEVAHEASGLDDSDVGGRAGGPRYENSFVAMASDVQYRPPLLTPRPRFFGTMTAFVYAEAATGMAEVDEQGRYRVHLPFDRAEGGRDSSDPDRKASAWIRMAQPYVGEREGMYFPLRGGTEVLLTFINGDPDRPIIAGAVPNTSTPALLTSDRPTESVIQTAGNNRIRMEDQLGSERIMLETPSAGTWIRVGAPNDPDPVEDIDTSANGVRIQTGGSFWTESAVGFGEYVPGYPSDAPNGAGLQDLVNVLAAYGPTGLKVHGSPTTDEPGGFAQALQRGHVRVATVDTFNTQTGNIYDFGGYWNYNLGNSYAENHIDQSPRLNQTHLATWPSAANAMNQNLRPLMRIGMIASTTVVPAVTGIVAPHAASIGGGMTAAATAAALTSLVIAAIQAGVSVDSVFSEELGDVIGGPESGDIQTWAQKVGSSFTNGSSGTQDSSLSYDRDKAGGRTASAMHTNTTWVEKKFGDSYSFTQGNAIEITHGHKEDHVKGDVYEYKYGGVREATNYSGQGIKTSWERSESGVKQEIHWDPVSGDFVSYEYSNHGHFSFSISLPSLPKVNVAIAMSSVNTDLSLSTGMKMNFSAAASMSINVDLVVGMAMNYERKFGGKLEYDEIAQELEFTSFSMKAKKEAALKAHKQTLVMEAAEANMTSKQVKLAKSSLEAKKKELDIESGLKIQGV